MGQITKVTPDMIQVANNVTSTTIGNTTSGVSLTFDSNGVITSAANVVLSVANTQLTGTITNAQLGTNAVSNTKIAAGAVEQYFADTGYEAQFRNRIINGDMRIDQRNAGAAVTANAAYPVDRFLINNDTTGAYSGQQDSSAPAGFVNSVKFTTTTADTSIAASEICFVRQFIEGTNVSDLAWGTASAKSVTLSFWVRSSLTGSFSGAIANDGYNRSYPFLYTISVADTWEYKTVTIPGDTTGTWLTTTGIGLRIYWNFGTGTDNTGTAGSWVGAGNVGADSTVSVIGTLNATWYITGVQLEVGSVATPFERRPFGAELALCQRYYQKSYDTNSAVPVVNSVVGSTGGYKDRTSDTSFLSTRFKVEMRATPTVTTYDYQGNSGQMAGGSNSSLTATVYQQGTSSFNTASGTGNPGVDSYVNYAASSEL
jgi:hypothetical protein